MMMVLFRTNSIGNLPTFQLDALVLFIILRRTTASSQNVFLTIRKRTLIVSLYMYIFNQQSDIFEDKCGVTDVYVNRGQPCN